MTRIVSYQSAPEFLESIIDEREKLIKRLNTERLLIDGVFQYPLYQKLVDDFLDSLDDIIEEATEEIE